MKTKGLINIELLDPRDWRFGGITGLKPEILRPDGQWIDFVPVREVQVGKYIGSTQNCVSHALTNVLEILLKAKYDQGFNFSERVLAKMAGTTQNGARLDTVAETARTMGLVNQEDWDIDLNDKGTTWEKYYEEIPQALIDKANKFINKYEIGHEWIGDSDEEMMEALKSGPLQITWVYRGSYQADANGIIHPGKSTIADDHCSALIGYKYKEYKLIFDSFDNVVKKVSWDYPLRWKKRITITKKLFQPPMPPALKMPKIDNNTIIKDSTRSQHIALFLNGKKVYDPSTEGQLQILKEGIFRNSKDGQFDSMKTLDLNAQLWDAIPTVNLKLESV